MRLPAPVGSIQQHAQRLAQALAEVGKTRGKERPDHTTLCKPPPPVHNAAHALHNEHGAQKPHCRKGKVRFGSSSLCLSAPSDYDP